MTTTTPVYQIVTANRILASTSDWVAHAMQYPCDADLLEMIADDLIGIVRGGSRVYIGALVDVRAFRDNLSTVATELRRLPKGGVSSSTFLVQTLMRQATEAGRRIEVHNLPDRDQSPRQDRDPWCG